MRNSDDIDESIHKLFADFRKTPIFQQKLIDVQDYSLKNFYDNFVIEGYFENVLAAIIANLKQSKLSFKDFSSDIKSTFKDGIQDIKGAFTGISDDISGKFNETKSSFS